MIELPYTITVENQKPRWKYFPWIWKIITQNTLVLRIFIEESSIEAVEETYGANGEIDEDTCMIKIFNYDKYYNIVLGYDDLCNFLNTKAENPVGFQIPKRRLKKKIK